MPLCLEDIMLQDPEKANCTFQEYLYIAEEIT